MAETRLELTEAEHIVKYFAAKFSIMAEVSTFVNWRGNDGQD